MAPVPACVMDPPAAWSNVALAATGINRMLLVSVTLDVGAVATETRATEPAYPVFSAASVQLVPAPTVVEKRPLASVVVAVPPAGVMVTSCNGAPVSASFTVPDTVTTAAPPELLLLLGTLLLPWLALLLPGTPVLDCPTLLLVVRLLLPTPLLPDLLLLLTRLLPPPEALLLLPPPPLLLLLLSPPVPPVHADTRTRLDTAADRNRRMGSPGFRCWNGFGTPPFRRHGHALWR